MKPACEPQFLYFLDESTTPPTPQVSPEATMVFNAIYSGMIRPDEFNAGAAIDASTGITVGPNELA
jgi:hypothetical protein